MDAASVAEIIPDRLLKKEMKLALPGVPPGISEHGFLYLQKNVVHDKLELGVAAMAVGLLL